MVSMNGSNSIVNALITFVIAAFQQMETKMNE